MKFTREFLGGFLTYEESDSIVQSNSFFGYIFKSIWALIVGTIMGLFFLAIFILLAIIIFGGGIWVLCWIFE